MTSTTTAGSAPLGRDEAELQRGRPGGHFAAWEEPELFATEVRAAFRSVR
jgi:pimeloyl-ACP methyl ester carboxylesterase